MIARMSCNGTRQSGSAVAVLAMAGFTLVELAVVLVVVGLLAAGVLKGREVLINGRVASTAMEAQTIGMAVNMFRKNYTNMPGELQSASTRLTGCTANCNPPTTADGFIGDTTVPIGNPQMTSSGIGSPPSNVHAESGLFWIHLLKSGIYTRTNNYALDNPTLPPKAGDTNPLAAVGGTFLASSMMGSNGFIGIPGGYLPTNRMLSGFALNIVSQIPNRMIYGANVTQQGFQAMRAKTAMQIDRKMDDGTPNAGRVIAYGANGNGSNNCMKQVGGLWQYDEDDQGLDCNLLVIVDGQGV